MTDIDAPSAMRWPAPLAPQAVHGQVRLPGSKSMTARALILAAGAMGASSLTHPLMARDTSLMAAGLRGLGTRVTTAEDGLWMVHPRPPQGPTEIDCGLAGTVMRFLPPLAALADGPVTFDGDPPARQRPMGPLLRALGQLGAAIDDGGRSALPFTIAGTGTLRGGEITIDASSSSQLVSGLLLAACDYDRGVVVRHAGPPVPSAPHLRMTVDMLRASGAAVDDSQPDVWEVEPGRSNGRAWTIEPDLSNAAPFLAAALITGGSVTIPGWPSATSQPGDALRGLLTQLGGQAQLTDEGLTVTGTGQIHGIDVDLSAVGELTPVIAALCSLADSASTLRGISHLRGHETDRLAALARELMRLGSHITETADGLHITPRPMTGTVFETYDDHRMAQAAAVIGLAVPDVELSDVSCTSKTLPQFPALWHSLLGAQP